MLAGYAIASGFLAAKFFGAISAKIIIKTVNTSVPIQTYSSPNRFITKYVNKADADMFTRLLPIKITPKTSSILFLNEFTLFADFWPFSAALSSLI